MKKCSSSKRENTWLEKREDDGLHKWEDAWL